VHVLEVGIPCERAVSHRSGKPLEPADQLADLVVGQQPCPTECAHVGDRASDVICRELTVQRDRAGEVGDPPIVLLREPTTPQAHAPLLGVPSC
jgi:hypothetical protein